MERQILNLSEVKPCDVVRVIQKNKPPMYCVIKSCIKHTDIGKRWHFLSEKAKARINETDNRTLEMVEFDKGGSTWSMTTPVETADTFASLVEPEDDGYTFALYASSIDEVQQSLKVDEAYEVEKVFQRAVSDVSAVRSTYANIINASMRKLTEK